MRIRIKIALSVVLLIIMLIFLSYIQLLYSEQTKNALNKAEVVSDFAEHVSELLIITDEYAAYHEERTEEHWINKYNTTSNKLRRASEFIDIHIIESSFVRLNDSFSLLRSSYEKRQELSMENASEEQIDRMLLLEERAIVFMRIDIQKIITLTYDFAEEYRQNVKDINDLNYISVFLVSVPIGIVISLIMLYIMRGISHSINELLIGVDHVSKGELNYSIKIKADDETRTIADSFNKMTHQVDKLIKTKIKYADELKKLNETLELKVKERTKELDIKAKELEKVNIQLKEADRLKSMFIASVSHELRTPLNSIIGFTSLILMERAGKLNEEQKKQLSMVKSSSKHLLSLINNVIDVSKTQVNQLDVEINTFDLSKTLNEVVESIKPLVHDKNLEIISSIPDNLVIDSDEQRIKQITINFLGNAIKFTDEGYIKLTVLENHSDVKISVEDSGEGIKEDDLNKLFKTFSKLDHASEGAGLGLFLSKELANVLCGNITVESEYGKGSTFTLKLPIKYGGE